MKKSVVFWSWLGFVGDMAWKDVYSDRAFYISKMPSAKTRVVKYFSWLEQRGFGPGYYNGSGQYAMFLKSTFSSEEKMAEEIKTISDRFGIVIHATEDDFKRELKVLLAHAKQKRKDNPY